MNKILSLVAASLFTFCSMAQNASVSWGEEFKMKKGSTDLSVIHTEDNAVYLREGHAAVKNFVILATTRESATLVKLDKSMQEVYRNDFNKELKGKDFEDFFFLQDKLFLLATSYSKSDKALTLHAVEINKADGSLKGDWVELDSWSKESNRDVINYKADWNGDSSRMIIVSTVESKERNVYNIREYDTKLKAVNKPVNISNEFERRTFQLEDVIYATNGNIIMVGRVLEYQEGKKKKAKFLDFKNYMVRVYRPDGTLLKEINTAIDEKWLISTKLSQVKANELVLAAFYSNTKRGRETNGMLVQRINPANGEVISTSKKELNTALISAVDMNGDDDESKQERKEREKLEKIQAEEEGFSKDLRFRNFIATEDGGLVILAEEYRTYSYSVYQGTGVGSSFSNGRWIYYRVFASGNIMMSKMDAGGDLAWVHVLPKKQEERIEESSSYGGYYGFNMGRYYFDDSYNYPFYSGFASMPVEGKNTVAILFNDGSRNADVLQLGQKVRYTSVFSKSDCYYVALDAGKGTYTRSLLFSNDNIPAAMPRLGSAFGNNFYLVGKQERFLSKSKIAVGRISFK